MNNKKRIGLVLPNHPAYSETFFVSKIKGLQQKGIDVIVFTSASKSKSFTLCPVIYLKTKLSLILFVKEVFLFILLCLIHFKKVYLLFTLNRKDNMSFFGNLKNLFLNRYFLNQKVDWLHFGFGTMALERENVAKAIHAKMAVSFRGFDWYVYPLKNGNCYQKLFNKDVKYHVLSNGMKKDLIQNGIEDKKIVVIPPAIDVIRFHNKKDTFLKNSNEIKIISVGRLHWIKGYNYIFEAMSLLKKEGIQFKYSIVGEGVEKERLLFQAHQLGIAENIIFYGKVDHDEMVKVLSMHDIFIQYSHQEGFCNAVLEAQAMELLCIVSDADGLRENVVNGETGWVIEKRNPVVLFKTIINVMRKPDIEKNKITHNAKNRVENYFSIKKQTDIFFNFYS